MKTNNDWVVGVILCAALGSIGPSAGQTPGASADVPPGAATAEMGGATIFAGVRLWANQWEIPSIERIAIIPGIGAPPVLQDVVVKSLSKTEFVPIPIVGMRIGNFLASASYFVKTGYDSQDPLLGTVDRDEFDVNVGYAVLPSLVLSVGYKQATDSKLNAQFSPAGGKVDGILLGASASAPLGGKFLLYGNAAYGFAREKTDFKDAGGNDSYSGNYRIGEVGLTYLLYDKVEGQGIKSLSISFGYRAQNYTAKSVALGTFSATNPPVLISTQAKDINTTTDGFILGIVGTF
jgi:hypothetical protein